MVDKVLLRVKRALYGMEGHGWTRAGIELPWIGLGRLTYVWHCSVVNVASSAVAAAQQDRPQGASVVEKLVDRWFGLCDDYRRRERRELVEREAPEAKMEEFRQELKWLLRSARLLQSLVNDPEYPAPRYAEEIAWRLHQLEDSWKSLHNPLGQAEADALLKKHFPDDPLAAKLLQGGSPA